MRLKTKTLLKEALLEPIQGVFFRVRNDSVFLTKRYHKMKMDVLIENDIKFFKALCKTWEKTENPITKWMFFSKDWKMFRDRISTIILTITNKCNSNCNICFMHESKPWDEMNIKDIKYILSKIGKNNRILLFGGEPTVRRDLFKIIRLIKKSKNIPILYTNGLKLKNLDYVKKLKKAGVSRVHFSLDGFREEIYEKLRGKDYLYEKLKALKNLEKCEIDVYISSTIAAGINEDQVSELLKFAIKNNHFIKGLYIFSATPYGRFNIKIEKLLAPSDIIKLLEEASSGRINKEYFLEFKKLRVNINRTLEKFGKFFPVGYYLSPTLFKVEKSEIKEFIPLKDLKKINNYLQKNDLISVLRFLLKNKKYSLNFLKLITKSLNPNALGVNNLNIMVGFVTTPINYIPMKIHHLGIAKIKHKLRTEKIFFKVTTGPG